MKLLNKRILVCSHYSAPYAGNFIKFFLFLSKYVSEIAFVFPLETKERDWIKDIKHKVYFASPVSPKSCQELESIIQDFHPDIVHCNFEGYDIAAVQAVRHLDMKKHCKVVWQLHDPLSYIPHPIKALYQRFCFYRHYGYYGRFAHIFSVSEENVDFVHRFNKKPIAFIPNGADTERLHITFERSRKPFIFLAFGGRNISKRIDLLIRAAQLLHKQKEQNFEVWLTNGTDTQQVAREIVGNNFPSWLKIVEQQADVSKLYDRVSCFVSTSEHETFSYAICEASISGLPVVQSDIEPTMWNARNPSTFVFHFPDIKDLAEQMKKVMEYDPAQLEERCRKTSKTNVRKYSLETWATKVIDFYRSL